MARVSFDEMKERFYKILIKNGFSEENAENTALVFARNSLDGVYTHGYMRFPRLIQYLQDGDIDPKAEATCEMSFGAMERWDGHRGVGPLNAKLAMDRAIELAGQFGIGVVALGNNNHWMRGGSYGWQVADAGMIGICWSNTTPNMPAWGGKNCKIGNNPLVLSVPGKDGAHVVVDCAMSQFSYGKLEETRRKGQQLPIFGGYNEDGELSTDPAEIEKTRRVLPMGYWKGSGLSILLDMIVSVMTNSNPVHIVGTFENEVGLCQMMIALDPSRFDTRQITDQIVEGIIQDVKSSEPAEEGGTLRYPGERELATRKENLEKGIPVLDEVWDQILALESMK